MKGKKQTKGYNEYVNIIKCFPLNSPVKLLASYIL